MEALIGFILTVMVWLTFLTNETRKQRVKNEKLENQHKTDMALIQHLKRKLYGKEETKED